MPLDRKSVLSELASRVEQARRGGDTLVAWKCCLAFLDESDADARHYRYISIAEHNQLCEPVYSTIRFLLAQTDALAATLPIGPNLPTPAQVLDRVRENIDDDTAYARWLNQLGFPRRAALFTTRHHGASVSSESWMHNHAVSPEIAERISAAPYTLAIAWIEHLVKSDEVAEVLSQDVFLDIAAIWRLHVESPTWLDQCDDALNLLLNKDFTSAAASYGALLQRADCPHVIDHVILKHITAGRRLLNIVQDDECFPGLVSISHDAFRHSVTRKHLCRAAFESCESAVRAIRSGEVTEAAEHYAAALNQEANSDGADFDDYCRAICAIDDHAVIACWSNSQHILTGESLYFSTRCRIGPGDWPLNEAHARLERYARLIRRAAVLAEPNNWPAVVHAIANAVWPVVGFVHLQLMNGDRQYALRDCQQFSRACLALVQGDRDSFRTSLDALLTALLDNTDVRHVARLARYVGKILLSHGFHDSHARAIAVARAARAIKQFCVGLTAPSPRRWNAIADSRHVSSLRAIKLLKLDGKDSDTLAGYLSMIEEVLNNVNEANRPAVLRGIIGQLSLDAGADAAAITRIILNAETRLSDFRHRASAVFRGDEEQEGPYRAAVIKALLCRESSASHDAWGNVVALLRQDPLLLERVQLVPVVAEQCLQSRSLESYRDAMFLANELDAYRIAFHRSAANAAGHGAVSSTSFQTVDPFWDFLLSDPTCKPLLRRAFVAKLNTDERKERSVYSDLIEALIDRGVAEQRVETLGRLAFALDALGHAKLAEQAFVPARQSCESLPFSFEKVKLFNRLFKLAPSSLRVHRTTLAEQVHQMWMAHTLPDEREYDTLGLYHEMMADLNGSIGSM